MKSGDTRRRELLRLLMAAFKQVEVDQRKDLTELDAISILMTEAKKRREAIDEAEKAGRVALGEQEKYELAAIEAYLPRQLSRDEIEKLVRDAVQEVGATTPKDMGRVMKALMPRVQGQADGKLVNSIVKDVLG